MRHGLQRERRRGWSCCATVAVMLVALAIVGAAHAAATLAQARQVVATHNNAARASQKRVDAVDAQTSKLLNEYRASLRHDSELQDYVTQLQPLLGQQAKRIAALQQQVAAQAGTDQQMLPLMLQMAHSLAQFVKLDLPFLPQERAARIANLNAALVDRSLSLADKFQQLAQAYQVEAKYGRSFGHAARGIVVGGQHEAVEVLRVGRVALLYKTSNGSDTGYWDAAQGRWVSLHGHYARDIREGLRIARGDLAATPLPLPVPTPAPAVASEEKP